MTSQELQEQQELTFEKAFDRVWPLVMQARDAGELAPGKLAKTRERLIVEHEDVNANVFVYAVEQAVDSRYNHGE